MAALRGTKVIRVGSSGIPAYDSLEEITSPTEGMVVKINGQEGEDRGVLAGDVLGVVTWAAAPNTLAYSYENAVPITLLTFTDGTEIYTLYNELMEEPYTIDFAVYHGEQNANPIASLAFNEGYNPPASWNASSYNFGGRTVQAINDNSIQNAIKVQSPALPDKYYIYDEGWVEMVDVSATTAEEADVLDGEIFYKADGTQAEGTLVPLDISDADAAVGDVVASKTFYATSGGKKTGTMTDRGTVNTDIATKAQEVTIAAGKHSGSGVVKISATEQAKIIAGNIKSGVTLLGQAGSVTPAKEEETKTVTSPSFASGNIVVNPTSGKVMTQVTINKDTTNHVAGNIKDGVTLYGVEGVAKIAIEITQDDYDDITTPDENVYYIIIEEA